MALTALLSHFLFATGLFGISVVLTRLMLQRVRIMDVPNSRSAHATPTPKSGGVAIVATFCLGCVVIFSFADRIVIRQAYFHGFLFSALLIAAVSLYDDVKDKPFVVKLVTQFVAVILVLASGLVIDQIAFPVIGLVTLGWLSFPLSFFWIVGLTNAFNFMDGVDGLAGGVAAICGAFFCYITYSQGSTFVYVTSYAIVSGTLGFLVYNWNPARIFMGDVGSAFLGFVFAVLAIVAASHDASHTSFLVMPLLLFNFIFDTFFTFVRRLLRGERVVDAHRVHLYQLCNRMGFGHRKICFMHYGMCIAQGFGAIWMVNIPGAERMFVYVPFLIFQVVYACKVVRLAKARQLL